MTVVILANTESRRELAGENEVESVKWVSDERELTQYKNADIIVDLLYTADEQRERLLKSFGGIVVISSAIKTLRDFPDNFVRINGWPQLQ